MYYQIIEQDGYYEDKPLIAIGNEKAILHFVNERNDGADEPLTSFEDAKDWLLDNGYDIEEIKDFSDKLEKGEIVYIQ